MNVTRLEITHASPEFQAQGLYAWLRVTLNDAVIVNGVGLRKTRDGRLILTWPRRRSSVLIASPASAEARARIEAAILRALEREASG